LTRSELRLDAVHGPILPVSLRPEPERAALLRQTGRAVPEQVQGWALIDTGARLSCIDNDVGHSLYQQVGVVQALTPSTPDEEPHFAPVYYGYLVFGGVTLPSMEQTFLGMSLGHIVQGKPILALLGRDWLGGVRMVYDGLAGKVDLEW